MQKENNLLFFRSIYIFFKVCGLAPFSMDISKQNKRRTIKYRCSRIGTSYNIAVLLFFLLTNCACMIYILSEDERNDLTVGRVLNIIHVCGADIFLSVMLTMYCLKQKLMVTTANRFINLNNKFMTHLNCSSSLRKRKYTGILIISIQILQYIIFYTCLIIRLPFSARFLIDRIGPGLSILILACFVIQYSLVLSFLEGEFGRLNESLILLTNSYQQEFHNNSNSVTYTTYNDKIKKKLLFIQNARRILFEVSCEISDMFGCPIFMTISYFCYKLIFNAYGSMTIITSSSAPVTILEIIYHTSLTMKDLFPIIVLTAYGTKIIEQTKRSSEIVHKVMAQYPSDMVLMKYQLEQFSMELLHQGNISFTACGFFTIDGNLLQSIISTTITYMIILLQYTQK